MPEVSIIVPVYNGYKYIDKCIESLVNQTFKDIEIILVNDGSTDNVAEKLNYWEQNDGRIHVIDNKNHGAAFSRNQGIEHSKGKYISFIDSDDWCHKTMIEKLYFELVKNQADYVFCDYYHVYKDGRIEKSIRDINNQYPTSLKNNKEYLFKIDPNVWNKMYKRTLLVNNNIRFEDKIKKCHDLPFTTKVLTTAERIVQVKECLYYYCVDKNENSITKSFNKTSFEWEEAWPATVGYFKDKGIFQFYYDELERRLLSSCLYLINRAIDDSDNVDLIERAIKGHITYLDENFPNWKNNKYIDNYYKNLYEKTLFFEDIIWIKKKNIPILIFSASTGGQKIIDFLNKFKINPTFICDNSESKQNLYIDSIKVVLPQKALDILGKNLYIIIASITYYDDIRKQLVDLDISNENILYCEEILR